MGVLAQSLEVRDGVVYGSGWVVDGDGHTWLSDISNEQHREVRFHDRILAHLPLQEASIAGWNSGRNECLRKLARLVVGVTGIAKRLD